MNFTVYRGDYIVLETPNNDLLNLVIPGLEINQKLPKKSSETSYIKIKKSGKYDFTLGDYKGHLTVLELESPKYSEVTAKEALTLMANIKPFILDVRTQGEYEAGFIENATLLPVQFLKRDIKELEKYKNEPILVYCQSGNRSTVAARILIDNGFTNIYNLRYGIGDWKSRGYNIVK
ncbi:hypothetical protein EW093_03735 [Thiospirochaeta perfilievii]|uniref:Rhodanese domain-containing protein n=1 Tax=Thiospirochaeta perfilievii TaxID=252967 RepID=A0A5C1Q8T8_9SPIO|nr:rhodanese-like domain-containing protein [Thiospirochaeta perfilievii]QEN03847.1 hypothetical protein EW093_03735 [Thiospirochaeta perfilievii]